MTDWSHRPLDEVYAAIFIDAIVVKIRDGAGRERADLRRDRCHIGRG
jgi:transposase-like protein